MSGKLAKSQIPIANLSTLSDDVRRAIAEAKNSIRDGVRDPFGNEPGGGAGSPLPKLAKGCSYHEFDVGHARAGDPQGRRGQRRLVIEVVDKSRQIREIYYTDDHYAKFSFVRVV